MVRCILPYLSVQPGTPFQILWSRLPAPQLQRPPWWEARVSAALESGDAMLGHACTPGELDGEDTEIQDYERGWRIGIEGAVREQKRDRANPRSHPEARCCGQEEVFSVQALMKNGQPGQDNTTPPPFCRWLISAWTTQHRPCPEPWIILGGTNPGPSVRAYRRHRSPEGSMRRAKQANVLPLAAHGKRTTWALPVKLAG